MNTIKVSGTGDTDARVAALEQAVNYGEVILPFPVIGEVEGGGGTVGPAGPPGETGATGPPGPQSISIGPTPPVAPVVGQLWWRNDPDGMLLIYYNDGTSTQWVAAVALPATAAQAYLLAGSVGGVPAAAASVGLYVAAFAFTLPVALAGSQAVAKVAATAQTDFGVTVNGVAKGSIRWAAAATVATFVFASAVSVAIGDRVEVLAPGTPDATLSDPAWTLRGTL